MDENARTILVRSNGIALKRSAGALGGSAWMGNDEATDWLLLATESNGAARH